MKKLHVVFIILAVLVMALPAATMPLFANAVNTEKRELSKLPAVIREDGSFNQRFSVEMNTWIQEHIGFRNLMVTANSRLRTGLFGQGATDDIVVGRDGWLFYYESVDDFLHVATITERNAANAAHTAAMFQRYAGSQGSRFLLAFLPNKNSVYGRYMPYYYVPRDTEGNRELFLKALEAEGVSYVDVKPALEAVNRQLYQKQDSHWTYEGALIGYRTVMAASGMPYNYYAGLTFTEKRDWPADLAVYLYGEGAEPDVQAYPDHTFVYGYASRASAVDSLTLETYSGGKGGSLVMYRDSFANTMQAYLAENFGKALFSRALPYQADLIAKQQADLTILQVTERSLASYVFRAPQMPAPQTELEGEARPVSASRVSMHREDAGLYTHLYGTVDETLLGDTYRVFLLVGGPASPQAYEAFPIYEKELLGPAAAEDNGWSLYLPKELLADAPALTLCVESGGERYLCPLGN